MESDWNNARRARFIAPKRHHTTGEFRSGTVVLKAKFLALEHPADFIEALRQRVVVFEGADSDQNTGLQDQGGATASVKPSANAKQPGTVPPPTPASARQPVLAT